ncbi:hypothetical protein [uncultured Algibacter sp.]|uniref:hypothetical protein n=1 Tax=uncultured Algibacter sp. TaxID=298659 RepID=UPI002611C55B|nr:hypothetical protein [uncultured Algibacter sp.]
MLDFLKKNKAFQYEKENSFKNSNHPCLYIKKQNGYVVFFIIQDDIIDFGVYTLRKKLITFISNINFLLNDDSKSNFINENIIENYINYLLKKNIR